ncbi:DUF4232 domain-containing protein [Micromonospora sp. MSM11]|nr:DUF4232 domain-containing protein [Micromonospora sp. MSM11]MCL7459320.1 DUF4232 domain-containing protein [Micromonospora sp. MSM11]
MATPAYRPAPCPRGGVPTPAPLVGVAMAGLVLLGACSARLELVNSGTEPYPLNGHPVLRLHDGDGNPIPVRVVEGAKEITSGFDPTPQLVTSLRVKRQNASPQNSVA